MLGFPPLSFHEVTCCGGHVIGDMSVPQLPTLHAWAMSRMSSNLGCGMLWKVSKGLFYSLLDMLKSELDRLYTNQAVDAEPSKQDSI